MMINSVKYIFGFYSKFFAYSITFTWKNSTTLDPYFAPVKNKFHLAIWHYFQFVYPNVAFLLSVNLYFKWKHYLANHEYTYLIIHVYFIVLYIFAMSFQFVFLVNRTQIIEMLNQTVKISRHLEKGLIQSF